MISTRNLLYHPKTLYVSSKYKHSRRVGPVWSLVLVSAIHIRKSLVAWLKPNNPSVFGIHCPELRRHLKKMYYRIIPHYSALYSYYICMVTRVFRLQVRRFAKSRGCWAVTIRNWSAMQRMQGRSCLHSTVKLSDSASVRYILYTSRKQKQRH